MSENDTLDRLAAVCRSATELAHTDSGQLRRVRVQIGDTAVELEWLAAVGAPARAEVAVNGPAEPSADGTGKISTAAGDGRHLIRSPMVGTFYHAPEPGAEPFVRPGSVVVKEQQIGIIEAMKLMNSVQADISGEVIEILVADGTPVEYDQPLLALKRAEAPGH